MARKIAVITGSRAEWGLLRRLCELIHADAALELQLIVTGMHLAPEFGNTVAEVTASGLPLAEEVQMLLAGDDSVAMAKSMGMGMIGMADALHRLCPHIIVVLGDRFESFAAAATAATLNIPIAHLHGGEASEGAVDDVFRHAITKLSLLHFTAAEPYARRVIQMGETPDRVHVVGAFALDALINQPRLGADELAQRTGLPLGRENLVLTFHPVTREPEAGPKQLRAVLDALDRRPAAHIYITKPNADAGGRTLIQMLQQYADARQGRVVLHGSLGQAAYLSLIAKADAVVGNSSSGLLEAPWFRVPSIDIGDRQKGRLAPASVIRCAPETEAITAALEQALAPSFRSSLKSMEYPFGDGSAAERTLALLKAASFGPDQCMKPFHDLAF